MKNIYIVTLLMICLSASAQVNMKSGLIIGIGSGALYDTHFTDILDYNEINYKNPDLVIGYKFRLQPSEKSFFYDVDIIAGLKRFEQRRPIDLLSPSYDMDEPKYIGVNHNHTYFQFTLSPSWNYQFYDRWYAGVGINPTVYMVKGRKPDNRITGYKFDMPAVIKVGYSFKYVDVALSYNYGLFDIAYSDYISKSKMKNCQIQVFIPF